MTFGSKYTTKRLVFVLCPNVLQKLTALPLAGVRVGVGVYGEEGRDGEVKDTHTFANIAAPLYGIVYFELYDLCFL